LPPAAGRVPDLIFPFPCFHSSLLVLVLDNPLSYNDVMKNWTMPVLAGLCTMALLGGAAGCSSQMDVDAPMPEVKPAPTSPEGDARLRQAVALEQRRKFDEAAAAALDVARQYPDTDVGLEAGFQAAKFMFEAIKLEDNETSRNAFLPKLAAAEQQLQIADARVPVRTVARVHTAAGEAFMRASWWYIELATKTHGLAWSESELLDKCRRYARKSLEHDAHGQGAAMALVFMAQADFHEKDYAKAQAGLEKVLSEFPHSDARAEAQRLLAQTKLVDRKKAKDDGRIKEALDILKKARGDAEVIRNPQRLAHEQQEIQMLEDEVNEVEARRMFDQAEVYRRYGVTRAAYVYYRLLIKRYPTSKLVDRAQEAAARLPLEEKDRTDMTELAAGAKEAR
jgi:tetratricopeptide (TPR) repeat protein